MSEENIFLALLVDRALHKKVVTGVQASVRKYGFTGTPTPPERLHISLLNFGRWPHGNESLVAKIATIAATVRFPTFEITLDTAMSFQTRRKNMPFVLTGERSVEGVRIFQWVLYDWFFGDDFEGSKPPAFTPHLTLIYDRKLVPKHGLERPLSWTAREFVLVRSHVGEGRYDIAGRWPLITERQT